MSRALTLALACLLAVAALSGCGAEDLNPDAVAEAADATRAQGGMQFAGEIAVSAGGERFTSALDGEADLEGERSRMEFDLDELADASGPEVSRDDLRTEVIMIGDTMYMKMGAFEEELGTEWVRVDVRELMRAEGLDFEGLQNAASSNPTEQLRWLRATSDVERVGEEEVDGVATTRYRGEVDLRRVPDTVPEDEREEARRSIDRLVSQSGMTTIPTEVWIDDDGLLRRQRLTMTQTKPQRSTTTMDLRFSDFGRRVAIEPPEGDVQDMTEEFARESRRGARAGG